MNTQKETLEKVSDVTLEQPVIITVDVKPQGIIHRLLLRWGMLPGKRVYELRPITLGTLIRISQLLLSINMQKADKTNILELNYMAIEDHGETMAKIIALAIRNSKKETDMKLVRFILQNFTASEIMTVLGLVVKQMDLTSFMSSIISIRGMNVLAVQKAAGAPGVNGNEVSL